MVRVSEFKSSPQPLLTPGASLSSLTQELRIKLHQTQCFSNRPVHLNDSGISLNCRLGFGRSGGGPKMLHF